MKKVLIVINDKAIISYHSVTVKMFKMRAGCVWQSWHIQGNEVGYSKSETAINLSCFISILW